MDTQGCLLCDPQPSSHIPLTQIVESFRILLRLLETQATKVNANKDEVEKLRSELQNAEEENTSIKEEKKTAQERSDTYKKRFLEAQDAITTLHEENRKLHKYSKKSSSQERAKGQEAHSFPFAPVHPVTSGNAHDIVLAPDTCRIEFTEAQDITYISSDEEDFQREPRRIGKSPKRFPKLESPKKKKQSVKVKDSFFAMPKFPPTAKLKSHASEHTFDMDETRMDTSDHMETSLAEDANETTAINDSRLMNDNSEWDSIPPSPVLSVGKERRFGLFQGIKIPIPKYKGNSNAEVESPSILRGNNAPFLPILLEKSPNTANEMKVEKNIHHDQDLQGSEGHPVRDSLTLLRKKTQRDHGENKATNNRTGNTSLDDLFNKTDGDLETTALLNDDEWDDSEDDEDVLDALLLQGVDNMESNTAAENIRVKEDKQEESRLPRPVLDHSFDVVPSKIAQRPKFKYQEVVRKQDERRKLDGKSCVQCEAYYKDLSQEARREKLKEVCRHKHVYLPPSTPEHFWEVEFPSTAECKRRGYIVDRDDLPTQARQQELPRFRRKKPLGSNSNGRTRNDGDNSPAK